jgi:phospholipid-binding lipoprotein MlaA
MLLNWPDKYFVVSGELVLKALDKRESNIETLDEIQRSSLDFYAAVRDAYSQARAYEIRQELEEEEKLPEF